MSVSTGKASLCQAQKKLQRTIFTLCFNWFTLFTFTTYNVESSSSTRLVDDVDKNVEPPIRSTYARNKSSRITDCNDRHTDLLGGGTIRSRCLCINFRFSSAFLA